MKPTLFQQIVHFIKYHTSGNYRYQYHQQRKWDRIKKLDEMFW